MSRLNHHSLAQSCLQPILLVMSLALPLPVTQAQGAARTSKPISAVLREPLPPEELHLSQSSNAWKIVGPTFQYHVQKTTGAITSLKVQCEGQEVIGTRGPVDVQLDDCRLATDLVRAQTLVLTQTAHQIVLCSQGLLRDPNQNWPDVDCTLLHTFFDDGVVVTTVTLKPKADWPVKKSLLVQVEAQGRFTHYLHKRRDEHGDNAVRGPLPGSGEAVHFGTLTSCLQVFGHNAGLALFTDCGATWLSQTNLDTAAVVITSRDPQQTGVRLRQYLVQVAPGDKPRVLKEDEEFTFRFGSSVTPNRIAPARLHDLRMFAWIGDAKFPYPTNDEIEAAAQNGYTVFQMHRLGTPGEPRPPPGELKRVINKVHDTGMLFLWTENADLMYDSAPGVQQLKAQGQFSRWQGFNYGGRYKASMDPYCDLVATCLASPNGLAEYRLATIRRMLERFAVDGIYLDDNLAYPNCSLWREHGHPRPVYDCLIELHEMNWQRRQLLRSKCPHLVLVSHNTRALVLPVLCDFDAVLYGEGYSFGSLENYWDYYRPVNGMPAQGMIWPGGQDPVRCAAGVAYNYDLLTGGGQYCYIDWRLFPKKFLHAAGVTETEHLYVQTYNLAQYYFGLYESKAYCSANSANLFGTSTPLTYATVYRNQMWGDYLIAVANMGEGRCQTALEFRDPRRLDLTPESRYVLFDVVQHRASSYEGEALNAACKNISIAPKGLRFLCLRPTGGSSPCHLWGGKRLSEEWDAIQGKLTVAIQGPTGLQETLFFVTRGQEVGLVKVNGNPQPFFFDSAQGLVHGNVTFTSAPLRIELFRSRSSDDALPQRPVPIAPLAQVLNAQN